MKRRKSGVLMHISSLPSPFGIGDMGPEAFRFAEFLRDTEQKVWQVLPLTPVEQIFGNSPYNSTGAFAGNKLFISPELLVRDGYLTQADIETGPAENPERVNFQRVLEYKEGLLRKSYECFLKNGWDKAEAFKTFCSRESDWLEPFARFSAFRARFRTSWLEWAPPYRDGTQMDHSLDTELKRSVHWEKFVQYLFWTQWFELKAYCNQRGIEIFGDLPIYVSHDSADVWSNPTLFKLDEKQRIMGQAGVPPDYFSATGQLWGNPVYRWDVLQKSGFDWWVKRMSQNLKACDVVRIDHFRGLVAFWEVPAGENTAINGRWVNVPVYEFFHALKAQFPHLPLVAEDLGIITDDVREVMQKLELPGMKVLLFAFGGDLDTNPYVPHNIDVASVVYPGTHDNNTVVGWFKDEASEDQKSNVARYLGMELGSEDVHWAFIRMAMMSVAEVSIIAMQDLLGLESEHRMNQPATVGKNWEWRMRPDAVDKPLRERMSEWTRMYGRA